MIQDNFDELLDLMSKAQRAREMNIAAVRETMRAPRKRVDLNKALRAIEQLAKTLETQRYAAEQERKYAVRAKLFELRDKATEMYKSGRINGDDLCRFEAHWNRSNIHLYPPQEKSK